MYVYIHGGKNVHQLFAFMSRLQCMKN